MPKNFPKGPQARMHKRPGWNKDYPRIQILTVEEILAGKQVDLPPNIDTYKQAQKLVAATDDQRTLEF